MLPPGAATNVAALYGSGGPAYDPASLLIFASFTTPPSTARKTLINNFVVAEKANGNWAKMDALWVPGAADGQAASINWKNPGALSLGLVGAPTFTADRGWTLNGTTQYLTTGYIPSSFGGQMTRNDAGADAYINAGTVGANNGMGVGGTDGANTTFIWPAAGGGMSGAINTSSNGSSIFSGTSYGLNSKERTASTVQTPYKNGSAGTADSAASTPLPTVQMFLGAYNNNGAAAFFSDYRIPFGCLRASLGAIGLANLYTDALAYLTAIGAN